jgi:hypothetical protein
MRRYAAAALLSTLAMLVASGPAPAKTQTATRCVKPTAATVTHATRYVVLYRRVLSSISDDRILYWACLRATGKRTRLTDATSQVADAPIFHSRFRTSRRFIAYVETRADRHGNAVLYVYSFDLRTGRRAPGIPANGIYVGGWTRRDDGTHTFGIPDLVVSDTGGLAWRAVGQPTPASPAAEAIAVRDADGVHTVEVAAMGSLLGPTISTSTVTWEVSGVKKTYHLKR